ncbi:hypothetical protein ABDM77_07390 [Mangrovibacter phragmitis]
MKFRLSEFNTTRYSRGADAARVDITEDDGDQHWLWMSPRDIEKNVMLFGPHLGFLQAAARYSMKPERLVKQWREKGDKRFLQPVKPARSEHGYWRHPDWPDEESDRVMTDWLNIIGYEIACGWMDGDKDAESILERCYGNGDIDILEWQPKQPEGEGWFIVSIHDHEDGPVCIWLRDKGSAA